METLEICPLYVFSITHTVIDPYGVIAYIIGIAAISLGVTSVVKQCRIVNFAAGFMLIGLICGGIALSAYSMKDSFFSIRGGIDPTQWFNAFTSSCVYLFPVMLGCALGFAMIGLSFIFTLRTVKSHRSQDAEQAGHSDKEETV
jgi:hypothetical protein